MRLSCSLGAFSQPAQIVYCSIVALLRRIAIPLNGLAATPGNTLAIFIRPLSRIEAASSAICSSLKVRRGWKGEGTISAVLARITRLSSTSFSVVAAARASFFLIRAPRPFPKACRDICVPPFYLILPPNANYFCALFQKNERRPLFRHRSFEDICVSISSECYFLPFAFGERLMLKALSPLSFQEVQVMIPLSLPEASRVSCRTPSLALYTSAVGSSGS